MQNQTHLAVEMHDDVRTDYALIATGIGAALAALIYLLLI